MLKWHLMPEFLNIDQAPLLVHQVKQFLGFLNVILAKATICFVHQKDLTTFSPKGHI